MKMYRRLGWPENFVNPFRVLGQILQAIFSSKIWVGAKFLPGAGKFFSRKSTKLLSYNHIHTETSHCFLTSLCNVMQPRFQKSMRWAGTAALRRGPDFNVAINYSGGLPCGIDPIFHFIFTAASVSHCTMYHDFQVAVVFMYNVHYSNLEIMIAAPLF